MQTVLITGGTGLIGKALTKQLTEKGYHIIILTRGLPATRNNTASLSYASWNIKEKTIDIQAIQQADYIIHLAGAGVVDKRWTAAYKKEIQDSRTQSSELLLESLAQHANKVKAVVSASAIGWYGEDPDHQNKNNGFVETDHAAPGFLGDTCRLWEKSIEPVQQLGIRLVKLRTGIVLSNNGGALPEFKKPIKFGVAAILGSGKQILSWVHIDDLCRIYAEAIQNEQFHDVYNAVAPLPVSNKVLTLELAKKMKGSFFIPMYVPEFVLKLVLGESSIEVLKSTTVSCKKIQETGFSFLYPSIETALAELCRRS